MEFFEILKTCPLFDQLNDKEIKQFTEKCEMENFTPGQFIIRQGSEGSSMYVILDGKVDVVKNKPDSSMLVLAHLVKGDFFGELILLDQTKRSADVVAVSAANVLKIKYEEVIRLYQKAPKVFSLVILNMAKLLTKRLEKANMRMLELK